MDRLLAPLARLMVARGVPFPDLAERLKQHYVQAAGGMTEGKLTDSRLSVLTGLQRRDVARLRDLPEQGSREHHLARLIALWRNDPDFKGRALPKNGPEPSFEALARRVRKDIHPRTMLDALAEAGAVAIDPATQVVSLLTASYQPLAGSEDQIAYLTENLGDHFDAATDNVLGTDAPHFERAVYYTALSPAQVDSLRESYEAAQMQLFEELSAAAAAMKKANAAAATPGRERFRAGGYFYRKQEGPQ
ncbi:MAG: DUF6502 family protein [Pseudomonadota bacterium]